MTSLRGVIQSVLGRLVRGADRLLPLPLLRIVSVPGAAAYAAYQLLYGGPTLRGFRVFPPSLRRVEGRWRWAWRLWNGRTALVMTKLLRFLTDRLHESRWQAQCGFNGVDWMDSVLAAGRPAILVTLHFGNLELLPDWLRARGVTAAVLSGVNPGHISNYRNQIAERRDHDYGMGGIPRLIQVDRLFDVRDFLSVPGRVLIVAVDAHHKTQVAVRGDGFRLWLTPGALRLATIVNAGVVPCLIRSPRGLSSSIDFGCPVPDEDVSDPHRHQAACEHIVREFLPVLGAFPDQCDPYFLHYCLDTDDEPGASEGAEIGLPVADGQKTTLSQSKVSKTEGFRDDSVSESPSRNRRLNER